jgi:hypothetical protein
VKGLWRLGEREDRESFFLRFTRPGNGLLLAFARHAVAVGAATLAVYGHSSTMLRLLSRLVPVDRVAALVSGSLAAFLVGMALLMALNFWEMSSTARVQSRLKPARHRLQL